MSLQQQKDILDHTYKLMTEFNHGRPPVVRRFARQLLFVPLKSHVKGNVAPWWEVSKESVQVMLDKGIVYGSLTCVFFLFGRDH